MKGVVFVAPFFLDTTLRFVDGVADAPGARLGLVSQDPIEKLPDGLRAKLAAHYRVEDALDPDQIATAVRGLAPRIGSVHRLLATLEELQVPIAEVRERLGIEGMGVEAANNFRDKSRMKDVIRAAGLPCARHALAATEAEARAFAERIGFPLVVKPPAGAGARNTYRLDGPEALRECLASMPPRPGEPLLLEEFITGEEHSLDTVVIGGKPVWHSISRYFPGPLDVVREKWIQWCVMVPREVDHPRYDGIRKAGFAALAALGAGTALCHMEWFRRQDGSAAISEVGARPPGAQFTSLHSWANDFDLYKAWGNLVVNDAFQPPKRKFAAGIAFFRGQGTGHVRAVHGLDQAQEEFGRLVVEARLPKAGQPPATGYEGEGFVIIRHPETDVVERALHRLVSTVRVELA